MGGWVCVAAELVVVTLGMLVDVDAGVFETVLVKWKNAKLAFV